MSPRIREYERLPEACNLSLCHSSKPTDPRSLARLDSGSLGPEISACRVRVCSGPGRIGEGCSWSSASRDLKAALTWGFPFSDSIGLRVPGSCLVSLDTTRRGQARDSRALEVFRIPNDLLVHPLRLGSHGM